MYFNLFQVRHEYELKCPCYLSSLPFTSFLYSLIGESAPRRSTAAVSWHFYSPRIMNHFSTGKKSFFLRQKDQIKIGPSQAAQLRFGFLSFDLTCALHDHWIIGLLDYWIIRLLNHWIVGSLDHWIIGYLSFNFTRNLHDHWIIGSLDH